MDKNSILKKYKKEEEKLIISKLLDKIQLAEKQNKIQYTSFLSPVQLALLKNVLNMLNINNYIIYGGVKNAQRNIIIIYPLKLKELFNKEKFDYNSICNCIRITNIGGELDHKMYLGGLIKLGIKREKIGDIIVHNLGADIIVNIEVSNFLITNLKQLTRFKNCNVEIIKNENAILKQQEFKELTIIISSLRLDNLIAELCKTSRSKAVDILKSERVFINYNNEQKSTKIIKENDIVSIRGVGKFIIVEIVQKTRSGRFVVKVNKYI